MCEKERFIFLIFGELQVCILEKISRLQATILKENNDCSGSPCITLGVSLDRGEPVQLHFTLTGDRGSFYETRKMNRRREIFHIRHPLQGISWITNTENFKCFIKMINYFCFVLKGSIQVKMRAWNMFSSLEVEMFGSGDKNSDTKGKGSNRRFLNFNNKVIYYLPLEL